MHTQVFLAPYPLPALPITPEWVADHRLRHSPLPLLSAGRKLLSSRVFCSCLEAEKHPSVDSGLTPGGHKALALPGVSRGVAESIQLEDDKEAPVVSLSPWCGSMVNYALPGLDLKDVPCCSPTRATPTSSGAQEPYPVQLVHLGLACHVRFIICEYFEPETGDKRLGHCGRWRVRGQETGPRHPGPHTLGRKSPQTTEVAL